MMSIHLMTDLDLFQSETLLGVERQGVTIVMNEEQQIELPIITPH
jgi:hypothetical protein